MKRKQPFWVRLFSPVKLKTQRIDKAGSHPRVRLAAFNVFVGVGSFLVAFVLGSFLLIPGDSNAEESIATLSNDPALAVAITPENLNLSITPTPSGALSADELNINVNTDNETGYVMSLASANETTDLTDVNTSSSIHSTTATTDNPAVLSANTWGWYPNSLVNNPGYNNSNPSDSNYQFAAIPSYDDPYTLKQTNTATSDSGDNIPVSIAANVDTSLPAGAYSNIITITTITNYVPRPILDVYPTTGWAGDTITLYSNDGFINVTSVTVGGTECTSINLISQDELQCVLPDKAETNPDSDNGYNITVTASGTELDTHNFTIRYFSPSRTETASVSNTQITNINMDTFTSIDCGSLSVGDIVSLTDERNGQTYRIKKMQDEKCWMVDNMKYKGEGITISNIGDGTEGITLNDTDGRYNTVDGTDGAAISGTGTNYDKAFYNNPMVASYCYGTSIQSSYTKCGYLYNWYAATAGTGTYNVSTDGTNVPGSICPTGWRLPSAYSDGSTATGNGTSYTAADFAVLNASMNAGSLTTGSTSSYPTGWQFTGAWSGVFSGNWSSGFYIQGSSGVYWSSTALSSTDARYLLFNSSYVNPGNSNYDKHVGFATRCVKDGAVTITYDGNGADNGSMDTQLIAVGDTQNLLGNTYTRTGYEFIGWNTSADGSGQSYNDGTSYTVSTNPDNYYPTLYAQWKKLTFACTARYKLQNADGTYPSSYTTVTVNPAAEYGSICSYTTTQNSSQYTNQSAQATVTGPTVLTVGTDGQVPRRTYNLTVTAGSNTSGATGSGTYRYGQTVTASVTKATNTTCTSYATPTWSKNSGATGTLSSTSGTSITYTMGTTNDTITATSASGNINQTITFYTTGGASSITLNGTSRTNGQTMDIACGTYNLTGTFNSGYEFSSWSKSGSGSITNTGTLSTTYTVNGTGSITLNGKNISTPTGYMQDFTLGQCQYYANSSNYTLRDRRDNNTYTVRYINGNCWMTQNLRLSGGRTLTTSDSNVTSNWYFPSTQLAGASDSYTESQMTISSNASYGGYYNYCAASAGTIVRTLTAKLLKISVPKVGGYQHEVNLMVLLVTSTHSCLFLVELTTVVRSTALSVSGGLLRRPIPPLGTT